ncbi:retrovirus-related pol polyprotein from transposon TNT 1-94 [Tanacetum coccineum]
MESGAGAVWVVRGGLVVSLDGGVTTVVDDVDDGVYQRAQEEARNSSKRKDGIQFNVDKFENASKSLNKLIECQIVDHCKKGLGYNAVPPPYTGNFMPPTPDLSFTGLDEFVNKPVVENRKSDEEVSKGKEVNTARPKVVVNAVKGNNVNDMIVVKASKDPYDFFHGRTPTFKSFMRHWGVCYTLNTIDHLGKFDGKADEGSGPDWLFDIDALTRTMNYKPIVAGTQSNGLADSESSQDDGSNPPSDDKKKVDKDPRKDSGKNAFELKIDDPIMPCLEEPKKVIHALKDPSWIEAMQEELLQFKLQEVWTLVDLPNGKRAIGTKWVFKNKKDERGIVIRNKARLVAQGYTQEERIDYDEVFAPVARIE